MSIQKECADHLRQTYRHLTNEKLGSGHAHEIVAAFFGYGSAAALRTELKYQLDELNRANILIPHLALMDQRVQQLQGLHAELPEVDDLASQLCDFLRAQGHFSGTVWHTRDVEDYINSDFIQNDPMMIEDDLSSEIATTNAYFDELYIDEVALDIGQEALVALISGSLNGETDQDRAFHGDSIAFTTVMTFQRVAGRVAYEKPELETSGAVDMSKYYDDEEA
ncbi:MAG: hypothetical protein ACR2PC_02280 [Tsuneonella suprasediminis]